MHLQKQRNSYNLTGYDVGVHQVRYLSSTPGIDVGVHLSRDQPSTPFPTNLFAIYDSDAGSDKDVNENIESCEESSFEIVDDPPSKKRKTSFDKLKSEKLSYEATCKALQTMKENAHYCCSMLCLETCTYNISFCSRFGIQP